MHGAQRLEVHAGGGEREGVPDAQTAVVLHQGLGGSFHLPTE